MDVPLSTSQLVHRVQLRVQEVQHERCSRHHSHRRGSTDARTSTRDSRCSGEIVCVRTSCCDTIVSCHCLRSRFFVINSTVSRYCQGCNYVSLISLTLHLVQVSKRAALLGIFLFKELGYISGTIVVIGVLLFLACMALLLSPLLFGLYVLMSGTSDSGIGNICACSHGCLREVKNNLRTLGVRV